nr:MAG TPA: hypothetical protein [Caudoviricetes sp.]
MRIISQNGAIDVPYEHTTLIRIGTEIYLSSIKLRDTLIAKYSTEEKAIKAMEMCRKKYADSEFNRSVLCGMGTQIGMLTDDIAEVFKDGICDKFTFRFPKDEEVEV